MRNKDRDDTDERYLDRVIQLTLTTGGSTTRPGAALAVPPIDSWQFPRHPGKTVIVPAAADLRAAVRAFVQIHTTTLRRPDCWLGTWHNPRDQQIYLDITTSRNDLVEARRIARRLSILEGRRIVALYNQRHHATVFLATYADDASER